MPNQTLNKQQELIDKLIAGKLITKDQFYEIDSAARIAGVTFNEMLLKKGKIDHEQLAKITAEVYNIAYVNIVGRNLAESVLHIIPIEVAENFRIICFESAIDDAGHKISVGIVDPSNFKAIEVVNFLARGQHYSVKFYVISQFSFDYVVKQYKSLKLEVKAALKDQTEQEAVDNGKKDKEEVTEEVIKSAPVAKIVSVIIRHAIDGNASDIHIEPLSRECRVRYRIDGILHTSLSLPRNVHDSIIARIKVLANLKLDETRIPQDGRVRITVDGRDYDFRVSILPLVNEEKVVMRVLDTSRGAPSLEELGFWGNGLEIIRKNIQDTSGMLLVTGPTGSGKSTTLFSILNILNDDENNICTLEDPVEYYVRGVNQSQIRPDIGFSFATGLRSLLRQDPDIIMVGEVRDSETAELAIHAALTGHFILSTLHTNSAIGAIPRLMDMQVEPFLLASTLNTIVAQRLGRKICKHCRTEDIIPDDLKEEIQKELKKVPEGFLKTYAPDLDISKPKYYKGAGCARCGNSGYAGRVSIFEVIDVNDVVKDLIVNKKRFTEQDIIQSQKFVTMIQDGYIKAMRGLTTLNEVLRVLQN